MQHDGILQKNEQRQVLMEQSAQKTVEEPQAQYTAEETLARSYARKAVMRQDMEELYKKFPALRGRCECSSSDSDSDHGARSGHVGNSVKKRAEQKSQKSSKKQ